MALPAFLAGCKGIPTKGENEARRQIQNTTAQYRPDGRKPPLPVLTNRDRCRMPWRLAFSLGGFSGTAKPQLLPPPDMVIGRTTAGP